MIRRILSLSAITIFAYSFSAFAAVLLLSDEKNNDSTFTFNVGPHAFYFLQSRFFVGATEAVPGNTFAVSAAYGGSTLMQGLTPEKVKLNAIPESENPLFGAAISNLTLMGQWPVVVKQNLPSRVFLIDDSTGQVFQSSPMRDGNGNVATALYSIETIASRAPAALEAGSTMAAFAAIDGDATADQFSLALLFFKRFTAKGQPYFGWDIVDAATGALEFTPQGEPTGDGNKALLITRSTPQLIIYSPLSSLSNAVDLHYDRDMGRLYVATQVTGGAGSKDGARAIMVGGIANGKLVLQEIAPASVFQGNDGIVGGQGSLASVTIHKVRTLFSKTLLRYLIVVGGNGTAPELARTVYALPLVDNLKSPDHGKLANVTSVPLNLFDSVQPFRFLARIFVIPAKQPNEIFTTGDSAARVGAGTALPGPITDIDIAHDTVMVSVKEAGNGLQPGIFSSQPVYDSLGRINGWTAWQRVAGTAQPITGFRYDSSQAVHWYIPAVAVDGKETTHSILRTAWSTEENDFSKVVTTALPQCKGGVQGAFDFPRTTAGFSQQPGKRLSVMALTGFETVLLTQTGGDNAQGLFGLVTSFQPLYRSKDGTLSTLNTNTLTLVLSGGSLTEIGPINAAAIATDGTESWFVVGGFGGVAVLAGPAGEGWDSKQGLTSGFGGLRPDFSWKIIRSTPRVRKLMTEDAYLFVLSDERLQRLQLTRQAIAQGTATATTVAELSVDQLNQESSFSDAIISGPLALLATSFGLLRTGNAVDVRLIDSPLSAQWTSIALPEAAGTLCGIGPASRLFAVTKTGAEQDLIAGGTLYVVNGYVGLSQTQLYRFAVQSLSGIVTDQTVQQFPDFFIRDVPTFFANPGEYRNYFVTDGALFSLSRSAFGRMPPFLELLNGVRAKTLWLVVPEAHSMGKLVRNSASGAWVASGDFGVRFLA